MYKNLQMRNQNRVYNQVCECVKIIYIFVVIVIIVKMCRQMCDCIHRSVNVCKNGNGSNGFCFKS